ncbi:MAG TPA: glycosyltransferase family 4 protein [Devosiaceae bacterium]|nr:glycosyltransferase family 4 protein [Devosiaceae bacterium]
MPPELDLLIVDTHPMPYKAAVFAALAADRRVTSSVLYFRRTDEPGGANSEFGQAIDWNAPLFDGYPFTVLPADLAIRGLRAWRHFPAVWALLRRLDPKIVLFTNVLWSMSLILLLAAKLQGRTTAVRIETSEEALVRPPLKALLRGVVYRTLYLAMDYAYAIGELNRRHLVKYGIPRGRIVFSPYSTVDKQAGLSAAEKTRRRNDVRDHIGIPRDRVVVAFFGKLIDKKHPEMLLHAAAEVAARRGERLSVLFVGSGRLKARLLQLSQLCGAIDTHFVGFVDQAGIGDYYLAADIVMLPSRRQGETWGLVVNEALQAGCAVVMSDAVGCSAEFGKARRCAVFPTGNLEAAASALGRLCDLQRDFDWAQGLMAEYSTETAAAAIAAGVLAHLRREGGGLPRAPRLVKQ